MKNKCLFFLQVTIVLIVLALSLGSCCSCKSYPEDLTIELGTGGGSAGNWTGYSLLKDGKVISWNGRMQGANPKDYKNISSKEIQSIWDKILESKAFDVKLMEPGNLSKYLKVSTKGMLNVIIWDNSRTDSLAIKLNILYKYIYNSLETKD